MARIPRDPDYRKPPRWDRLYGKHFPHNTDGASRHVRMLASHIRDVRSEFRAAVAEWYFPDHIAQNIETTVIALWEARARIAELEAALAKREA